MSAISLKSISGITSITTPAGVDNQFTLHNNNTTEAVKLDTAGNFHFHNHLNITGVSTASNFKTGTSNLHNTGLNVQDLDVDGHTNLDNVSVAGVSTVTTFLQVLGQAGTSDKGFEVRANSTQSTDTNKAIRIRNNSNTDTFNISYKGKVTATELDISGNIEVIDLSKTPHLLVAGTTGSGKSVFINTLLASILYKFPPEDLRLILIDPKMLELSVYNDIAHLLTPVVTEPKKAIIALKWVCKEMERRYAMMNEENSRSLEGYNLKAVEKLPYIVVFIDEMADLMMTAGKEVEHYVQRLAQMARACGIHLVMATQRPSVDIITGSIKANFPSRVSFQVASKYDSRTVLGEIGAEQLLGNGDMLMSKNGGNLIRYQSALFQTVRLIN